MALQNAAGHYFKIAGVDYNTGNIMFEVYQSAAVRAAGVGQFGRALHHPIQCPALVDALNAEVVTAPGISVKAQLLTAAYVAAKAHPEMAGMEDC